MMSPMVVAAATCLGCGCTCDDIDISLVNGAIANAGNACTRGRDWFGTGAAPSATLSTGHPVALSDAIERAAVALSSARQARVLLAPDVSCEAYGRAVACADLLRARVDVAGSKAAQAGILAVQERGIATATLGELRNRADVMLFWGVDPGDDYPRYLSRYAPEPVGTDIPLGRRSRRIIAVDIDNDHGPGDADSRLSVAGSNEVTFLVALAALLGGMPGRPDDARWSAAAHLADTLRAARYTAIVARASWRGPDAGRLPRLIALGQALNVSGRGALALLRHGGNLPGAETVLVRQTGYPLAVDFGEGVPRYRAGSPAAAGLITLVVGRADLLADDDLQTIDPARTIAIGPHATTGPLSQSLVAIDVGVAGIHSRGTVVRMDDVALPVRMLVPGPPDAADVCARLVRRIQGARA